jgi:uncharacterized membrane protein YhaH (DUF805 family)
VNLVFHIFQGIGIAAAVGIRPFIPTLAVGALAAGDVEINFSGTSYHFLEGPVFLAVIFVGAVLLAVIERRLPEERLERPPGLVVIGVIALVLGALLFAGAISRGHHEGWPGWIAGVLCALVGLAATRPLFARVRRRLDEATASALPAYAEGIALLVAVLSVLAPPLGPIALALLLWLWFASRRRGEQKYAGLRILR